MTYDGPDRRENDRHLGELVREIGSANKRIEKLESALAAAVDKLGDRIDKKVDGLLVLFVPRDVWAQRNDLVDRTFVEHGRAIADLEADQTRLRREASDWQSKHTDAHQTSTTSALQAWGERAAQVGIGAALVLLGVMVKGNGG